MKKYFVIVCIIGILFSIAYGGWEKGQISMPGNVPSSIVIGMGRNDDTMRLYAGCDNGTIVECTYRNNLWEYCSIANVGYGITSIANGQGRNDETERIYFTCGSSDICELSFNGLSWVLKNIAGPQASYGENMNGIGIGCPRNDGINRVYAGHYNGKIYEFTRVDTIWSMDSVNVGSGSIESFDIGIGRNDGIQRIYTSACSNTLFEIFYETSVWQVLNFGWAPGTYDGIAIGDGKNVGANRIYSWSVNGFSDFILYEWRRQGSTWYSTQVGHSSQWGPYKISIGKGRADTIDRVYSTAQYNLYETSFETSWSNFLIDSSAGVFTNVFAGSARKDSIDRLYVTNEGNLYEYRYTPNGVSIDNKDNNVITAKNLL